jgi:spiro-SPASM protein
MKNTAVINGISLRDPAFRSLLGGESAFARALAYARRLPDVDRVVLLLSRPLPSFDHGLVAEVVRESWTVQTLLDELVSAAGGTQDVFYFHADTPFLDDAVTARMYELHRRYAADYTFADGYPAGLTPEILTPETARRLRGMAGDGVPDRETLFTVIRKDINAFDIETEISAEDQRLLRVTLAADTERNFLLLKRVVEHGGRDAPGICAVLRDTPRILRTLPAFFPVQVVERCPHACSYCPYPVFGGAIQDKSGAMPVAAFADLARRIAEFAGDAVIDVSLWGEPGLHPQMAELAAAALALPGIELVIETSGVGWSPGVLRAMRDRLQRAPTWIVSLDAASEEMYGRLRGTGFAEANRAAEELLTLFPATTWVQAVRMKENEEDLDVFYRKWKERTPNVIVQKYDSFAGLLPDRAVADLSPLKRFPCWHLKRDLAILIDGTVPLCREDVKAETRLGNAFSEDLAVIWDRAREIYEAHTFQRFPALCARCDEYYTYNY